MKVCYLGIRRKESSLITQHIKFFVSCKKRPIRSCGLAHFFLDELTHASSRGFGMFLTGQTPKSHNMSPGSIVKPAPSVKLNSSTTLSPLVNFYIDKLRGE